MPVAGSRCPKSPEISIAGSDRPTSLQITMTEELEKREEEASSLHAAATEAVKEQQKDADAKLALLAKAVKHAARCGVIAGGRMGLAALIGTVSLAAAVCLVQLAVEEQRKDADAKLT